MTEHPCGISVTGTKHHTQAGTSNNLSGGDINSGLAKGKCNRYNFSFSGMSDMRQYYIIINNLLILFNITGLLQHAHGMISMPI